MLEDRSILNHVVLFYDYFSQGSSCGVEYFVRAYALNADYDDTKPNRKSVVSLMIRKIQYAPMKPGRQPCTMVRKDFMFSPGDLGNTKNKTTTTLQKE